MPLRDRVRVVVDDQRFQRFIIGVIVVNSVVLGLQTSATVNDRYGELLEKLDHIALSIFAVELAARLFARRLEFFRDPWSWFDFVIVTVSLMPVVESLSVVRSLRILRALRLIAKVPSMRKVVSALIAAIPGLLSLLALLVLLLYVGGVMASNLFGDIGDGRFTGLGSTVLTLFQVITGDGWSDIMRDVMTQKPLAWIFFVSYLLVGAFVMVNLFIAVVCSAMESEIGENDDGRTADAGREPESRILAELQLLRGEVRALREVQDRPAPAVPSQNHDVAPASDRTPNTSRKSGRPRTLP